MAVADWFVPPSLRAVDADWRRARGLVLASFGMASILTATMLARGLTTGQPEVLRNAGIIGVLICLLSPFLLKTTGNLLLSGLWTPLVLTVLLALVAHVEGAGLSAPMMFAAPLVPGMGMALLGQTGLRVFGALVIVQALLVMLLPHLGIPRPPSNYGPGELEVQQFLGLIAATGLLFLLTVASESQREQAEQRLKQSEARHRALLEAVPDLMLRVDRQGRTLDVHQGDPRSIWPTGKALPALKNLSEVLPEELAENALAELGSSLEYPHLSLREFDAQTAEGPRVYEMRQMACGDDEVTVILRDITARKRQEEELARRAKHDSLTGLVNRREFRDALTGAIEEARRTDGRCALLFVDLDRFKPINDLLGHAVGDQVLAEVGVRLSRVVREGDVAARHGGDEFTVLLQAIHNEHTAEDVGHRILSSLTRPMQIGERELEIGASIGVAVFPMDGYDADALTHAADVAMYAAKTAGGDTIQRFNPSLRPPKSEERRL